MSVEIEKGDIYFAKFENKYGKNEKPVLIVSNNVGNKHSDRVEIVLISDNEKTTLPTHVPVMCQVPSVARCESIRTIPQSVLTEYVRSCSDKEMKMIDQVLMISLGITVDMTNSEEENLKKIIDLKAQLEASEASFQAMQHDNELLEKTRRKMEAERAELLKQIDDLSGSVKDSAVTKHMQVELVKAQAERDLYKEQFERLFERMIG